MIVSRAKFHGYQIKDAFLKAEDFRKEDILLYKALEKVLRTFPDDIDENLFFIYLDHIADELVDKACFYILAAHFKNTLFTKDKYYISELCTALTIKEVSPQNYIKYAQFFLSEPIYSLIINIDANSYEHSYLSLFDMLITFFNINNLNDREYNKVLKLLHKLLNENYLILFNKCSTLEDIYITLFQKMKKINKKGFPFTIADFELINSLKDYIETNDQALIATLKEKLLASEDTSYDSVSIIRECLKIIKEYKERIIPLPLSRRRKYEKK